MRSSRISAARGSSGGRATRARLALLAAALLGACAGGRGPAPAEIDPLVPATPPRAPLPDDAERAAGRLAAFVLAGAPDRAAEQLQQIRQEDARRELGDERPTGLVDNALEVIVAGEGLDAFARHAQTALESGEVDAELRRRYERFLARQPLALAESRLREDRRNRLAAFVNRLSPALARLVVRGAVNPWEAGRVVLSSWTAFVRRPVTTSKQRQALRAYQEYLEREPAGPEAARVAERAEALRSALSEHLFRGALARADRALEAQALHAAIQHLDRAERLQPGREPVSRRRAVAEAGLREARLRLERSLEAAPGAGSFRAVEQLSLVGLGAALSSRTPPGAWPRELEDERRLLDAAALRRRGDDRGFVEELDALARQDPGRANSARHAHSVLGDPAQNPYAFYARAGRVERRAKTAFVLLGSRAKGPLRRGLWRPLEWLVDLPAFVTTFLTSPLRLAQLPNQEARFGREVRRHAEAYVRRFPDGAYAGELRADLRDRYAGLGQFGRALQHERARFSPDPARIGRYRKALAERMLESAERERRRDARASILRAVASEYHDLDAGRVARERLSELAATSTPQSIRLSRAFLEENRALVAPGALGLRRELFDGEGRNGELAEDGITLLGQTVVRIAIQGREPVDRRVPVRNFARFISLLEEASYERLVTDAREASAPDPQRDLFFERARLGLLDTADLRPSATSQFEFLSRRETHGVVKRAESVLPVELVLRGSLQDLGMVAFPRIRIEEETDDAFLYE